MIKRATQEQACASGAAAWLDALRLRYAHRPGVLFGLSSAALLLPPPSAVAQHVASNSALQTTATASYPDGVWRDDFDTGVGAPPLWYTPQTGTCASNHLVNDGGSCIDTIVGDRNSWKGHLPVNSDAREWGDDPTGRTDSSVALQSAMNFVSNRREACGSVLLAPGTHLAHTLSAPSCIHLLGTPGEVSAAGTVLILNENDTYLLADASWVNNLATANNGGGLRDLILDGGSACSPSSPCGSKTTPTTGTIAVHIKDCFACLEQNLTIQNSDGFGELHTAITANGSANTNGEGANVWRNLTIQNNVRGGYFGLDGGANILADMRWDMMQFANNATNAAALTASQAGITLTVTSLTGSLLVGEIVSDNGVHLPVAEYIVACPVSGCSTPGNYTVSQSARIASEVMVANGYAGSCSSMRIDNGSPGNAGNVLATSGCTGVEAIGQTVTLAGAAASTEIIASLGFGKYVVSPSDQDVAAAAGSTAKVATQFDHDRAVGLHWGGGMTNFFYSSTPMNGNVSLRNASGFQLEGRFDSSSTVGPGAVADVSVLAASGAGNYSDGSIDGYFITGASSLPGPMIKLQMVSVNQLNSNRGIVISGNFNAFNLRSSAVAPVVSIGNCCTKVRDSTYSGGAIIPYPTSIMDVWGRGPDFLPTDQSGDGLTFAGRCLQDFLGSIDLLQCHLVWPGIGSPTHDVKFSLPMSSAVAFKWGFAGTGLALPESGGGPAYFVEPLFGQAVAVFGSLTNTNGGVANATINELPTPAVDFTLPVPVR